jgi:hypothetical protein
MTVVIMEGLMTDDEICSGENRPKALRGDKGKRRACEQTISPLFVHFVQFL